MPRLRAVWLVLLLLAFPALPRVCAQSSQKPLVLILIGPPASGKSTQARLLEKKFGMPVIADEQLREEARKGEADMLEGMNLALKRRLAGLNPQRGFILDGYPENRKQAEFLAGLVREFVLPQPLVVQIDVSDEVARQRAIKQKTDMKLFEARLREYQQELATARMSYPQADIWTINGDRSPQQVQETIRSLIAERLQ